MNEAHQPGKVAPSSGHYEELNIFGVRTGLVVRVAEGDQLPKAPIGFTWRKIALDSSDE